jgi:hypothetical protein
MQIRERGAVLTDEQEGPKTAAGPNAASDLLKPYDSRLMRCCPVSTRINHVATTRMVYTPRTGPDAESSPLLVGLRGEDCLMSARFRLPVCLLPLNDVVAVASGWHARKRSVR